MSRSVVQLELGGRDKYARLVLAQGCPVTRCHVGFPVWPTVVLPHLVLYQIGCDQFCKKLHFVWLQADQHIGGWHRVSQSSL